MPHTIVILGAGYAGIPLAHSMLKHTPSSTPIQVLLVAPNDTFYWHNAAPRSIIPGAQPDSAVLHPIADGFAQYPPSRFRFLTTSANSVDLDRKTVTLGSAAPSGIATIGSKNTISYDTLVIATGSYFVEDMPFKHLSSTAATKAALASLRDRVGAANTIVVAGAGMTGVEVAGELGAAGKNVTLISNEDEPLSKEYLPSLRSTLRSQIDSVGIDFVPSSRVIATKTIPGKKGGAPRTELTLRDKDGKTSTLTTDLYIPTFGTRPNTSFLPSHILSPESKRVRTRLTFQVEGYDDVFAMGDAADLQTPTAKHADDQWKQAAIRIRERIVEGRKELTPWKKDDTVFAGVSVGPSKGSGQMGGWKLPGFLIWWLKSRTLMVEAGAPLVRGEKTVGGKI